MQQARYLVFDAFRLDCADEQLWKRDKALHLGHKALAVLQRLASQPSHLITKDDLLDSAWPDTAVSESVLTTAIRELREVLGDDARTPRFIETVHGRGYRFIAAVSQQDQLAISLETAAHAFLGREAELARLEECCAAALQGTRRFLFIAGEAGIGKTALVEMFVKGIVRGNPLIGRGQCVRQYGAGEAYMPILEALGRLGRESKEPIAGVLRDHAPSWLAHLPSLGPADNADVSMPVTPARMLRELAEALEVLTVKYFPLILVLEDLHWSDTATLEWLSYAARRRDPARLLVVGTYRPVETLLHNHALRNVTAELLHHEQCSDLALDYLPNETIEAYVRLRFGDLPQLGEIAGVFARRTGGHPLFLTALADEILRQPDPETAHVLVKANLLPASVRQFIEHQLGQFSEEDLAILAAASVAGDPFCVTAVSAATDIPEDRIEARCASWAGPGRFVRPGISVNWPDGTLAVSFGFRHALYQEAIYAGISPERRAVLHRYVGERLEKAYGKRMGVIAAELAMHFEHGRDPHRAIQYLVEAARNAMERSAYPEVLGHLERGRKLLEALPEGRERLRRELDLLLLLGRALAAKKGWAVEEVESVYQRARDLCEQLRDTKALLQTLWGLIGVAFVSSEFRKAQGLGREVLGLAKKLADPVYEILGHMEVAGTELHLGELTATTGRHFLNAETLYHPRQHHTHIARFGVDMGLFSRSWATHFLWYAGYPDQARAKADKALCLASDVSHPFTRAVALAYATMLHQFCRDLNKVDSFADATVKLCTEHEFPYYLAWAEVLRGWSRAAEGALEEGVVEIRRGIEGLQAKAGARLPYYRGLLSECCLWAGHFDEAFHSLDRGFAEIEKTEERWWEPELLRIQGELLRTEPVNRLDDAEVCFHKAIEVARKRHAKSLELRATLSLGRLWRDRGRRRDGQMLVSEVFRWFTEGFDTTDLREAESLGAGFAADARS